MSARAMYEARKPAPTKTTFRGDEFGLAVASDRKRVGDTLALAMAFAELAILLEPIILSFRVFVGYEEMHYLY